MASQRRRGKKSGRSVNPLVVVLVTGGVFLVLLVVGLLVAKSMVYGWLKGEGLRDWLVKAAQTNMKSRVELAEMNWSGSEVYSDRFLAEGYQKAAFSKLELDGIRAKIGGLRNKAVMIPDVTVNRLEMDFSNKRLSRPMRESSPGSSSASEDAAEEVAAKDDVPGWLRKYLPNRVEVDGVSISSANISVANSAGQQVFALSEVRTEIMPDFATAVWEFAGRGGKMQVLDQPEIELKEMGLRWKESEIFIDQCSLGIYENGHIDGVGEIDFSEEGSFDVELTVSSIDVDELVEGDWEKRLGGTIEGPVRITGQPGAFVYEGTLNIKEGVIESLPVLDRVAQYTRADQFKRLVLSEAKTDFKKTGDTVELRNLALQSDGLIRVEGKVDITGEQLSGNLQVGVTPGTMRRIPGAERKIFTEDRDGFRWAPMTLAGTVGEPKEDLSGRLIAAAGEAIVEDLPNGLLNEAKKFLGGEDDGSSSSEVIEKGRKLLDSLTPFLQGQ